ncbi:protocatechuate 3,4-dioxygenase subunit alpha [Occallatibacter riparius]|uniref:Protocatechuate 3,4-dioxygenase subunit alpha n=1 Tax=Occallatibacter riparius TaxID=1002689 RepID=A0A9J7BRQ4_9BACT|nr:protocatechuate 3,4-dioxygenase subunit alpha [Occallatibacter riparius]UWZ85572.1 protocatechuate 3,4-dioxygenase subunit alpha [Occallatibacter riparius]
MSAEPQLIPASSQTVGPYFRIGLEYMTDPTEAAEKDTITIRGRVLDRDRAPVADAMLEFWNPSATFAEPTAIPTGFARAATDDDGNFCVRMAKPAQITANDGLMQAPHMLVLVFARGLLRHLISRVYFDGESSNSTDAVLSTIPADRRHTLVAHRDGQNSFCWNVVLQGKDETVFFAW